MLTLASLRGPPQRDEEARLQYRLRIGSLYQPEQRVFVDESHCNSRAVRRGYAGWVQKGRTPRRRELFYRGTKYVLFISLTLRF